MMTTGERLTSGLTRAWNSLRDSFGGLPIIVWIGNYWPMIAGAVVGVPFALMPWIFDFSAWTYLVTVPIGIAAGMIGYGAAYLYLEE